MRVRTILAAAAAPAALAATLLGTSAQPAHANTGNPNVTVTGKLTSCDVGGWQAGADIRVRLNGELRTWSSNGGFNQPPTYSVTFDNVPPGNGGYAWVVVHCIVSTPDHGEWIHIYRPPQWWTTTLGGVNL